jgi:spermidine/putrescine-binding protein
MFENDPRFARLIAESKEKNLSRRAVLRRGLALGISLPVLKMAISSGALAQEATPTTSGPVMVPIVGQEMTREEITAAIAEEGEVVVGNWTYTANPQIVEQFEQYVSDTYGVDVKLFYEGSQAPSTYLTNLYTAIGAGDPSPYDVLAVEENYWAEAQTQPEPVMEEFLPSGLVPNADRVIDMLKHEPTAIGFQASATPGIVYDRERAPYLNDWTDLADERLRNKLTMPLPGDVTAGGILLGLADALGKDYASQEEMREVIDYAVDEIGPNVVQYTTDSAQMQQLLRAGVVDAVGFWNSLARMEFLNGQENTAFLIAESGQYLVNGFMWIPKNPPHPVLAQVFINWRLSDGVQFPAEDWGIDNGPWAELQEGLLGPSYEGLVPEWFEEDYFSYYPTIDQLTQSYKAVDWEVYAANVEEWMDYYSERLGL